ncbi:MAG: methionyl-tRNA formyltransferase [Candidatus Eremiobacteraeota bacterium]|nr:methionyl-tRNA formyltransferase [Candidatus Eremiobacteraeota bacterium]NNM92572.1 methionyl-tRNA formyltransferase [Candidatus Eremiobacteraeota bacterium]
MLSAYFFGSSEFAVPSLLESARQTILRGVVTQPDRPSGRGHRLTPTPVKHAAHELGIPVFEPTSMRAFLGEHCDEPIDLIALASFGRILPAELLAWPRLGALNVHPSLLPLYRGATPIQSALREGARETGLSIMLMDAGMDTGPLVAQERVAIGAQESYGELHDRLAALGARMLGEAIVRAHTGELATQPQRGEASTTRPLKKEDLIVDLSWPTSRLLAAVRAFAPSPLARAFVDGEWLKIVRAHEEEGRFAIDEVIAPNKGAMSWERYRQMRSAVRG